MTQTLVLLGFLGLSFILAQTIKTLYLLWWVPNRLQRFMVSQGIKGPSYKFIHGNKREIIGFEREAMSKSFSLSDNIVSRLQPHIHAWTNLYGKCFLQWRGQEAQLVVAEPDLIKEVLSDKEKQYSKINIDKTIIKKILGDGLTMSKGKKWVKMRKLTNHAFKPESLQGMIPAIIESTHAMLQRWECRESGKEIDVYEEFKMISSEIISRTAFGSSYEEGKEIFEKLERLTILVQKNWMKPSILGLSHIFKSRDLKESDRLEREVNDAINGIIGNRKESLRIGEEVDFLDALLKAHNDPDEEQRISVDDMIDECKTLYFAGQETTTILLTWTIFLLAVNTEWQEKARQEVIGSFGNGIPRLSELSKLKIVTMIINESLRLYPPVTSMMRKVDRKAILGGMNLPANLTLVIPTLIVHHDPKLWGEDANLFKPERFSEGVAKATKDNMGVFFPFGIGPRVCVGLNFAIIEVKIALAMILQRFMFTLSPAYVHSPRLVISPKPQFGLQIILNPC